MTTFLPAGEPPTERLVTTATEPPTERLLTDTEEPPTERLVTLTQEIRIRHAKRLRHVGDRPAGRRPDRAMLAVALAATVLAVAACVYFYRTDRILGYHDTYSHLEISRRLLVGRTTGIAQLGAIWLPLPHLLQSLLAWNTTLYTTGLAGSIVSMTAFVACAVLIYRIVLVYRPDRTAPAVTGAAVFMLGANLLHHQATSMDELPFYAFALAATYGMIRWADTGRPNHLLYASIASMLAMLCRYEGWFLAGMLAVAVPVIARRTGHSWRDTRGLTGMFAVFGVLTSSIGWMLYNWMIAGSPLNFLNGPNSSADQMARRTTDVETGSLSKTLHAYGGALVADHGLVLLGLAAAGLVVFLAGERLSPRSLPIFALGSIVPFFLYTIYRGQAPIGMPPVNEYVLNARFALVAALPAAVLVGYLIARLPRRAVLVASVLVVAGLAGLSATAFRRGDLVSVQEVTEDLSAQRDQVRVATFLREHTDGPIMLSLIGNERAAFPVLDRVIYDGTKVGRRNVWGQALKSPLSAGAEVVLMRGAGPRGADQVYDALHGTPAMDAYHVVYRADGYLVYELTVVPVGQTGSHVRR
ncbi:ArnT family glycosyltransferase [Actinoplanes siamensis]|nr:glycosyltransferase family 39 protein [Actinoplanes siamensis]